MSKECQPLNAHVKPIFVSIGSVSYDLLDRSRAQFLGSKTGPLARNTVTRAGMKEVGIHLSLIYVFEYLRSPPVWTALKVSQRFFEL